LEEAVVVVSELSLEPTEIVSGRPLEDTFDPGRIGAIVVPEVQVGVEEVHALEIVAIDPSISGWNGFSAGENLKVGRVCSTTIFSVNFTSSLAIGSMAFPKENTGKSFGRDRVFSICPLSSGGLSSSSMCLAVNEGFGDSNLV
jgi:hypothetical protein